MATTASTPTRVDATLFAAAQAAGERTHRSAAQQLAHWARLGQELEAAAGLSQRDIDRALAGQLPYDELGEREQAAVRTSWREMIDEDVASLNLRERFASQGRSRTSEADAQGRVIVHTAKGATSDPDGPTSRRRRSRA